MNRAGSTDVFEIGIEIKSINASVRPIDNPAKPTSSSHGESDRQSRWRPCGVLIRRVRNVLPRKLSRQWCDLSFAHCVFVDEVVAGDDERIFLGEREVREVIDLHVERGGKYFAGVSTCRGAIADVPTANLCG